MSSPLPESSAAGEALAAILAQYGDRLLDIAEVSIREGLASRVSLKLDLAALPAALRRHGASFISLYGADGNLRGCIGTAEAWRPLAEDVAENAFAAAFQDPRFPPLAAEEAKGLGLSLSLLSAPEPIRFADEADLVRQLRPGIDGLILAEGECRSLFLPQVWEKIPGARSFLAQLRLKAGLAPDYFSPTLKVSRFSIQGVSRRLNG